MNKKVFGILLVSSLLTGVAQAQDSRPDPYLTIGTVEVREVTKSLPSVQTMVSTPAPNTENASSGLGDIAGISLDNIVNLGQSLWTLIEQNKPVANVTLNSASALPQGVKAWESLSGWQAPEVHEYELTATNLVGMQIFDFDYSVVYTYGGRAGGQGRYLANVSVIPNTVSVGWGYTFNASTTVGSVTNAASAENPVAAMQLNVQWSLDTVLSHNAFERAYYMTGTGEFQDLSAQ